MTDSPSHVDRLLACRFVLLVVGFSSLGCGFFSSSEQRSGGDDQELSCQSEPLGLKFVDSAQLLDPAVPLSSTSTFRVRVTHQEQLFCGNLEDVELKSLTPSRLKVTRGEGPNQWVLEALAPGEARVALSAAFSARPEQRREEELTLQLAQPAQIGFKTACDLEQGEREVTYLFEQQSALMELDLRLADGRSLYRGEGEQRVPVEITPEGSGAALIQREEDAQGSAAFPGRFDFPTRPGTVALKAPGETSSFEVHTVQREALEALVVGPYSVLSMPEAAVIHEDELVTFDVTLSAAGRPVCIKELELELESLTPSVCEVAPESSGIAAWFPTNATAYGAPVVVLATSAGECAVQISLPKRPGEPEVSAQWSASIKAP